MTELRWILLIAGLVLILGIYLWGRRQKEHSPGADLPMGVRFEPPSAPLAPPPASEPTRMEPQVSLGPIAVSRESTPVIRLDDEPQPVGAPVAGRREPTLGPPVTVEEVPPEETAVIPTTQAPRPAKQAQKIFSVRVTAPLPARFDGTQLLAALSAEGMTHGRYSIFHRLDPAGRPIFSVASVVEPGTFDPRTMPGAAFPGIAFFTVIPGPVKAQEAFDSMLLCAHAIAGRLDGHLQDDRGVKLTVPRVAHLRDELLAFERSLGDADKG
jgi:cell division protein ZipA